MYEEQLVVRYIRRKEKIRQLVTYVSDDCEIRQKHEEILEFLRNNAYPSLFAKAYVPGRGIFANAKTHLYNDVFLKMDIKNFFNSIDHRKLVNQLLWSINSRGKISKEECEYLVEICSCGYDGLPLGLVTSPELANLYLKRFDSLLYGRLKVYPVENIIYTRYADDLIISFKYVENYRVLMDMMRADVIDLLKEFSLVLNDKKTQIVNLLQTNHVRITGVSVIRKEDNYRHISVGKKLKNEVFWKAIELSDTPPESRNQEDVKWIKGMMSYILSIEKQGISFSYSRNMRQLVYDRGYKNLPCLVKNL